jgi:DNA-binding response OmpR family regulator
MAQTAVAVVGDDDVSLALIHLNLARRGYSVLVALLSHLAQGWQPTGPLDLLLVDLTVPEPQCWERTAELRALSWAQPLPLIVLNQCWPDAEWLARLAAHRHLRKPFAMDELIAAVEDALPRRPGAEEQAPA